MGNRYHYLEELEDFLGGTFHQDISSPQQALDEFINEVTKECLLSTIKDCEEFLNSDVTHQEKEDFIQQHAEVYFPEIELNSLQWLYKITEQMREALKTK
ncbi:contact-dependent growth inhibition system immunity protein [Priestia koreensis]|uniref:contact-dependent growth inhibition system immunity protein n=1 Tax=Priestia koreensis TaxID=284581 RepID=UPI00203F1085|nr:contact-dependent growth inhibition system immunity protein [Priestia koreensis]MCM3004562.1 contact-dependent growth inhibition system immunity protein [Priestia koreensis]